MNTNRLKNHIGIGFSIIGILILLYISYFGLTHLGTWYDEIFSMWVVNLPYSEFWTIIFRDVHPPLYYLIYRAFITLFNIFNYNDTFIIGKIVSLVPIYLLILLAYFKIRKNFGMITTGLFIFTVVAMPLITQQIMTIRMYSWALLFISASFIYIYQIVKDPSYRNWIILTGLTICSCYTQYFSLLSSVILYCVFLIYIIRRNRKLFKKWFISAVICVIAYVPWLPIAYNQFTIGQGGFHIPEITFVNILYYIYNIFSPLNSSLFSEGMTLSTGLDVVLSSNIYMAEILIFGIFLIAVILLILNSFKHKNKYSGYVYGGFLAFILLPTFGIIISYIFFPIFLLRYVVPLLGVFWLSMSILISCLYNRSNKLCLVFISLLLIVGCLNVANTLDYEQNLVDATTTNNETLHNAIGSNDIIIVDQDVKNGDWETYLQLKGYYLPDNEYFIITDNLNQNIDDLLNDSNITSKIDNGSKIFYITLNSSDLDIELKELDLNNLDSRHCSILWDDVKVYEIKK